MPLWFKYEIAFGLLEALFHVQQTLVTKICDINFYHILVLNSDDVIFFKGKMTLLRKSSSSQIWSLDKKKWMDGPVLPSKYDFINSCALALNSSTVLFVGVNIIKADEITQSTLMVDFLN